MGIEKEQEKSGPSGSLQSGGGGKCEVYKKMETASDNVIKKRKQVAKTGYELGVQGPLSEVTVE